MWALLLVTGVVLVGVSADTACPAPTRAPMDAPYVLNMSSAALCTTDGAATTAGFGAEPFRCSVSSDMAAVAPVACNGTAATADESLCFSVRKPATASPVRLDVICATVAAEAPRSLTGTITVAFVGAAPKCPDLAVAVPKAGAAYFVLPLSDNHLHGLKLRAGVPSSGDLAVAASLVADPTAASTAWVGLGDQLWPQGHVLRFTPNTSGPTAFKAASFNYTAEDTAGLRCPPGRVTFVNASLEPSSLAVSPADLVGHPGEAQLIRVAANTTGARLRFSVNGSACGRVCRPSAAVAAALGRSFDADVGGVVCGEELAPSDDASLQGRSAGAFLQRTAVVFAPAPADRKCDAILSFSARAESDRPAAVAAVNVTVLPWTLRCTGRPLKLRAVGDELAVADVFSGQGRRAPLLFSFTARLFTVAGPAGAALKPLSPLTQNHLVLRAVAVGSGAFQVSAGGKVCRFPVNITGRQRTPAPGLLNFTAAPVTAAPATTAPSFPNATGSNATAAPPTTAAPITAAPVAATAAPVTAAPVTAAPATSAPSLPNATGRNSTAAPLATAAPVTAAPVTAAPVAATAAPVTAAPVTAAPVTAAPSTSAPSLPNATGRNSTAAPLATAAPVATATAAPATAAPATAAPANASGTAAPGAAPRPKTTSAPPVSNPQGSAMSSLPLLILAVLVAAACFHYRAEVLVVVGPLASAALSSVVGASQPRPSPRSSSDTELQGLRDSPRGAVASDADRVPLVARPEAPLPAARNEQAAEPAAAEAADGWDVDDEDWE